MGKNLFEQTLNVDRTEINFNKVKETKINQNLFDKNLEKSKVKNVNITLYENDILKMQEITKITGAKLSSFVRKCIDEEFRKVSTHNK